MQIIHLIIGKSKAWTINFNILLYFFVLKQFKLSFTKSSKAFDKHVFSKKCAKLFVKDLVGQYHLYPSINSTGSANCFGAYLLLKLVECILGVRLAI